MRHLRHNVYVIYVELWSYPNLLMEWLTRYVNLLKLGLQEKR